MENNEKQFDKSKLKNTNTTIILWTAAFALLGVVSTVCAFTVNGGLTGLTESHEVYVPKNGPDPKDYYGKYYAFDESRYLFFELELTPDEAIYSTHFGDHDYKYVQRYEYDYFTEEYAKYTIYSPNYSRDAIVLYMEGRESKNISKFWVFRENNQIHFQNEGYVSTKLLDLKFSTSEVSITSVTPSISLFQNTYAHYSNWVDFKANGTCEMYINNESSTYNYALTKGAFSNQITVSKVYSDDLTLLIYDKDVTPDATFNMIYFFSVKHDGSLYFNGNYNYPFTIQDADHTYVNSVTLIVTDEDEFSIGTTKQLVATLSPSTADYKTVDWHSSNPSVASVSSSGMLTCHAKGTATITACTKGGAYTTTTIEVYDPSEF